MNDEKYNYLRIYTHPPTHNRWPIKLDSDAVAGVVTIVVFTVLFTIIGFAAFVFYVLRGRHAKNNWKSRLDVEDDEDEQERKREGVRVTSLKRKDREPQDGVTKVQMPESQQNGTTTSDDCTTQIGNNKPMHHL